MTPEVEAALPRRLLHTMLRVGDLDRSLRFYTEVFGMDVLRREDYPDGQFTLAFLGYGSEADHSVIELTHNWGRSEYERGNAYGHIALAVDDVYAAVERLKQLGASVSRPAGPLSSRPADGSEPDVIAFVDDPDGYRIELIQRR
ncbi:TPA: lactoylglutathione lyase [Pseudomonas aeruginosa]|uniref:Lactoylglutathione lyase n=4 Tax=Pseudomonadota TaxID=1224 RepID=A0A2K4W2J8_9PSED|nr:MULTISPECIES: lactoylglutathione lyase [Pseudomonas]SOS30114.1 Lactoylglutathione lyase [Pseudomonas cerasi]HCL4077758.1 lactoylglutathione lyase [Pseudomonas aeruginosa]MDH4606078.1 lactoylglutathione lyase [Pseudomonas syringae pv. papulans]MDH4625658.1 lactoylglutathione lyase [Pseudomonas syringae pv. papulans]HCL4259704.1 lactoylglutathione lyase [Pseudomonas aeruginosa]